MQSSRRFIITLTLLASLMIPSLSTETNQSDNLNYCYHCIGIHGDTCSMSDTANVQSKQCKELSKSFCYTMQSTYNNEFGYARGCESHRFCDQLRKASGSNITYCMHCKEVIGIELLEQNIEDARRSARLNSIDNCTFIGGKLEDVLPDVLGNLGTEDVVIILDPPRTGMIPELVRMLKRFRHAHTIIYICSNHKLPIKNLLDFCFNNLEIEPRTLAATVSKQSSESGTGHKGSRNARKNEGSLKNVKNDNNDSELLSVAGRKAQDITSNRHAIRRKNETDGERNEKIEDAMRQWTKKDDQPQPNTTCKQREIGQPVIKGENDRDGPSDIEPEKIEMGPTKSNVNIEQKLKTEESWKKRKSDKPNNREDGHKRTRSLDSNGNPKRRS
ncbi:hypothetical protein WDU94_002945 [Cyamophila willieti]